MNKEAVKEILEHLLNQLDEIDEISLSHDMPIVEGWPDGMSWEMSNTGEHIYKLEWRYIDKKQEERFARWLKG